MHDDIANDNPEPITFRIGAEIGVWATSPKQARRLAQAPAGATVRVIKERPETLAETLRYVDNAKLYAVAA